MSIWFTIFVFVLLFALSGLFSGSEISLFSLSRAVIQKLQRQKRVGAEAIAKLREKPHRLLATILIGNNIANIYAASLATEITIDLFGSKGVGIATGVVTFLILLFGEIFPKTLAQAYAQKIALFVARPLLVLSYILWPVIFILEGLSKLLVKMMPGKVDGDMEIEDEIRTLMTLGMQEGSTELFERDFVDRLFKFDDTPVSDVMIPYEETVLVDGSTDIDQISHFLARSAYSRFPVYSGSKTNVIGIVHVKDVFRANNSDDRQNQLETVCRPAVFVKAEEKLDDALNILRQQRIHSALVKDKENEVVGFVTMEDILERLIGDIRDEFDRVGKY